MILDTSILIAAERGRFDLEGFLQENAAETIRATAVTATELLHGYERVRAGKQR